MNNMNGIISECQHIYNSEVEIKDTKTVRQEQLLFIQMQKQE